jgi:hypothetical protein
MIETPKKVEGVMIPAPPKVVSNFFKGLQTLGKRWYNDKSFHGFHNFTLSVPDGIQIYKLFIWIVTLL